MEDAKLPKGWCLASIADVSIKGAQRKPVQDETFNYIDIGSINRDSKRIESPQCLLGKDAPSRARKIVNTGDVLVSLTRPNLNAVAYVPAKYDGQIASTGFEVIKALLVDGHYIFALTRSKHFIDSISGVVQGALYPAAKSIDVQTYEFPLPPLAEQKVIADKLDTLLAQVETTKARLERIPEILKTFRQSVLAAAMSGKLTEEWRNQNEYKDNVLQDIHDEKKIWLDKNSDHNEVKRILRRLKDSSKVIKYKNDKLPETWLWSQLEDSVLMIVDCHNKTAPYAEKGTPLIRTSNIRDGKFVWENLRFVSDETYEYWSRRCPPEPGDIMFTREAPMGEAAIIPPKHKLCLGQRTMLIRPIEKYVPAKFLLIALMDPNFRKRSEGIAVGTGVKHYRVGDVSNLLIAVPPTEEQTEIVRRVEEVFAFADNIEKKANAALERVNSLTQSILTKAFNGELTVDWRASNPELISGDNSAEALLEKIKIERDMIKKQPKPKRSAVERNKGSRMSRKIIKVVDALKEAGKPLSGQQLLAAAGYPSDSSTDQLERFFLDIREAMAIEKSIVKLKRSDDGQDWFTLPGTVEAKKS
ncbi:restriction endonuclease subunit S [Gilvimarinus japonicus]|uniref:Restriction endonuclease subunit S n=1 Tax=Gilvimarinus japonicus TaxID=1796469 RepID=A0ABV7HW83_9GAMM